MDFFLGWLMVLISLPLLSYYGRPLQHWIISHNATQTLAWMISLSILGLIIVTLFWLTKNHHSIPYRHLLWLLAIFIVLPLMLDRVEERFHFINFGLLGILSILVYRPVPALIICFMASGGDEILQYYLPDRVGDWRDVGFNILASFAAAIFTLLNLSQPITSGPEQKDSNESI